MTNVTARIESWKVSTLRADGTASHKTIGKIVHRDNAGRFDGATNHRQTSRVGQVRKSRR